MMNLALFLPITKVDEENRLVCGTVAEEVVDKADEIFDYASSKPFFEAWSGDIAAASEGRSVGNLRAMHGQVAAGKLTALAFDDAGRRIEATARVVDDAEWRKVLEGVYTGFSIGGHYVKRWREPGEPLRTRYTARPIEVSLVDNPCIPTATFAVLRADGTTELRKFKGEPKIAAGAESGSGGAALRQVWLAPGGALFAKKADAERHLAAHPAPAAGPRAKGSPTHPAGDHGTDAEAAYADPGYQADGKARYPLKEHGEWSAARIRSAWAYIHDPDNQRPYSADEVARIKARIIAAWREHIDPQGMPSLGPDMTPRKDRLLRAGARHSKADLARVNAIHRLAVELGADCGAHAAAGEAEDASMESGEAETAEDTAMSMPGDKRAAGSLAKLAADLEELAELRKLAAEWRDAPAPPKGGLYVVDKSADGVQPLGAEHGPREPRTPEAAIKAALARPMKMFARFGG